MKNTDFKRTIDTNSYMSISDNYNTIDPSRSTPVGFNLKNSCFKQKTESNCKELSKLYHSRDSSITE